MMGQQKSGPELFNYAVNLEKRVRSDHVLRPVEAAIDFGFVREEVAHCNGDNGNVSIASAAQNHVRSQGIFPESACRYDPVKDVYRWPAGETLKPRRLHWAKRTMEYKAPQRVCAGCVLRAQCTRAKMGRSLKRHEKQAALDVAKAQAHSRAAQRDRRRRRHLMEASFADAANNHHFKRARWRRLWHQQIQDYLIASIQNLRILLKHYQPKRSDGSVEAGRT